MSAFYKLIRKKRNSKIVWWISAIFHQNGIILKNFKVGNTAHITISDDNSCLIHAPHCFTSYFQLSYPRECKSKKIYITLMKSACSPGNPQGEKVTRKISLTINWWVIIIKSNLLFWNTQKNYRWKIRDLTLRDLKNMHN